MSTSSPAARKPADSWHSWQHIPAVAYLFFTASYCVTNAAYWPDFKNISSVWILTLHCDPSQDRELRPEEMDGTLHFRKINNVKIKL